MHQVWCPLWQLVDDGRHLAIGEEVRLSCAQMSASERVELGELPLGDELDARLAVFPTDPDPFDVSGAVTRLRGVSVDHRVISVGHHGGRELGVVPGSARTQELTAFVPDEEDDPNLGVVVTLEVST